MTSKSGSHQHLVFLLGAGASYGHLRDPGGGKTPPIMSAFLSSAVRLGILTEQGFPELARECIARGKGPDLLESCGNLERAGTNLESFLISISNDVWTLQLSRFFLFQFLGEYSKNPLNDDSAYVLLADYIKEHRGAVQGIISLNYDTLCESALSSRGVQFNYALAQNIDRGLLFLKPHGSVNFRFPIGKGFIRINVANWPSFLERHGAFIETINFRGRPVESYKPSFSFEQDFLTSTLSVGDRRLEYIPALVPPLGLQKHYDQFDSYGSIWNKIGALLKQTEVFVVIGSAMNKEDTKLWDVVKRNLPKTSLIRIVSSCLSEAQTVKNKFKKRGFKRVVPVDVLGFHEYAKRWLERGTV